MSEDLGQLIQQELTAPVDSKITGFAQAIAAQYGDATRAVLFYGSCLRSQKLEGEMLDFYLIVSDYQTAYNGGWKAKANAWIPPNVFPAHYKGLVAKYAVLSEEDFYRLNRAGADTVSVWARFAQPSRLVWTADDKAGATAINAIAGAAPTLLNAALAHSADPIDALDLWARGFALTYGAELRAERKDRSQSVVDFAPQRYRDFTQAALNTTPIKAALKDDIVTRRSGQHNLVLQETRRWPRLRRRGKWMTLARLVKASATYAGGIDYLAWKINRHAGTDITIRPWQRKWPVLGAVVLLPKLLKSGAVR